MRSETCATSKPPVIAWKDVKANLEQLQREILTHLQDRGLAIFRSFPRGPELGADAVYWDTESFPDYRDFVSAAEATGAKLITVYGRRFTAEVIEDAMEHLATARMDREDRRTIESRLRDLRAYEGFLCQVELSFSHGRRTYIFDQPTEWYDELTELLETIEDSFSSPADERPLGGFYSNN